MIGGHIFVYGRPFVLCSCDEFTKEYYRSKYGLVEFENGFKEPEEVPRVEREIPPYNGFGSEDDSLGSCISLIPKPPRKDFKKLMSKDNMVLRFFGRLDTSRSIDAGRSFIIYYYLADDTILVFEPHQRNSGIVGGKFLERMRIKHPDYTDVYYGPNDFFVGNKVTFMNHKFILKEADEYAYAYMEANMDEFPKANPVAIQAKINDNEDCAAQVQEALAELVEAHGAVCPSEVFRETLVRRLQFLTEHEIITLSRLAADADKQVQVNRLSSFVRK